MTSIKAKDTPICRELDPKGEPTTYKVREVKRYALTTTTETVLDDGGLGHIISSNTYSTTTHSYQVYCERCNETVGEYQEAFDALELARRMNRAGGD